MLARWGWVLLVLACSKTAPGPPEPQKAAPVREGAPYPIVLLHGMGGFGTLRVGPMGREYFAGVEGALRASGEARVYVTEVSPYAGTETRARELRPELERVLRESGAPRLNLIAHSQGGLDARFLASPAGLGMGSTIATITTISTPHRGTRIADLALSLIPGGPVSEGVDAFLHFLERKAYEVQGDPALRAQLRDLSVSYMEGTFNGKYVDDPRVLYESYAGRSNLRGGQGICDGAAIPNDPRTVDPVRPELFASGLILEFGLPPEVNDGLVPVRSAKWGTFVGCIPADHGDEIGLAPTTGFDHIAFYRSMVFRLRAMGY